MKEIVMEGKSVTIAVEQGLAQIGLRRDQVEVEVLSEGTAGFLGIGSKPAQVQLREKLWGEDSDDSSGKTSTRTAPEPAPKKTRRNAQAGKQTSRKNTTAAADVDPQKACATAETVLNEILALAKVEHKKVQCRWDKEQGRVCAEIESQDAGLIIGKGGQTIEALQFLVTIIVGRRTGSPTAIQVETQGYWKKIEGKVLSEAESAAAKVKKTGKPYRFEPLEASLRRLIHRKFGDHPDVVTSSEGEGAWRKVVMKPRT